MQAQTTHLVAPTLPSRKERIDQLRAMMGEPDPTVTQLTRGIRANTDRYYDQYVMPLIMQHWPEVLSDPFGAKLRFLTCQIYAAAPYTVLFCAPNRPWMVKVVTDLGCSLKLSPAALGMGARAAMAVLGRTACLDEQRRIIHVAAFVAIIDHVFDHVMEEPPRERGEVVKALLAGTLEPERPSLRLARALLSAMCKDLSPLEQPHFDAAMEKLREWVDSEVAAATGGVDPTGAGHRLAGVRGTIDGLLFPFHRFAGEGARQWMYDASLVIQMMDDYIDYDTDLEGERSTPFITGHWTFEGIEDVWHRTTSGIEELTRAGGLDAKTYVGFIRNAYVYMIHEGLEAVSAGIAD